MTEAAGASGPHKFVGGALCLDFVNTVAGWVPRASRSGKGDAGGAAGSPGRAYADEVRGERLGSYGALVRWAVEADALTGDEASSLETRAESRAEEAEAVHERALALRASVYRIFKCVVEGWNPEGPDLSRLNRALRVARRNERLAYDGGRFAYEWEHPTRALDRPLWPVARSAATLLTSERLDRVGQCPGDDCGWLFLDTSRSGRRRWCDMADCGNVAKVRRYRKRHRDG